ncbi:MAG: beta strand repeat-containing protein [Thermoleophilaceae bacterium]
MTNGQVKALDRVGDTIYLGGSFSAVGAATGPGVSLTQATGARDTAFPAVSGGGAQVYAALADGSGGFYVGGNFTHVGGVARLNLAHILSDGTIASFAPNPNDVVRALALSPAGTTLYAGGDFLQIGGGSHTRIAALDAGSGTAASGFTASANDSVMALAADVSRVYLGGRFTTVDGGASRARLAAVDASTGAFGWTANANNDVNALAVDASRVYAGGAFSLFNGGTTTANQLAALTPATGALQWQANGVGGSGVASLVLSGSSLFAGGSFTDIQSSGHKYVAKVATSNAAVDGAWNPSLTNGVFALALSGSTLYMGGYFGTINGQARNGLGAVNAGTAALSGWAPGQPSDLIHTMAAGSSNVYLGGDFTAFDMVSRQNLAAINAADGTATSWAPTADVDVRALVATPSTVYIGGYFNNVNNVAHDYVAAVRTSDGALVPGWDTGADSYVEALALSGSRLYVGGWFFSLGPPLTPLPRNYVGALDAATGAVDTGFIPDSDEPIWTLVPANGVVYAGGNFSFIGGQPRTYAAALDPVSGIASAWNPALDGDVYGLVATPSTVYLGGTFSNLANGAVPRAQLAAVDTAGGAPTSWNPGLTDPLFVEVDAMAMAGSTVYVGGEFSAVGGAARANLAAIDAGSGSATAWNPGASSNVDSLLASSDGTVVVGGRFPSLDAAPRSFFAIFSAPPENTTPPAVTGTPAPGQALDCSLGTWAGSTPQSYAQQWLQDGVAIGGATGGSYVVAAGDAGHSLTCRVAASNRAGTVSADSAGAAVPAATSAGGSGAGTPAPPGLAPPRFRRSANIFPLLGEVLVRLPGTSDFVPVSVPEQIPFGSLLDTRRGRVRICTADAAGKVQCAEFFGGIFKLVQHLGRRPITELILTGGSFRGCPKAPKASSARKRSAKSTVRSLWGDGSGQFRTRGRFASATIRGTLWFTADRCDGTLIRVRKGSVTVRDLVKRKSLVLRAPKRYLARARRR